MDVLTDVLQSVRLRSNVYGRMELSAPWGLRVEVGDQPHPMFYAVSRGTCWLEVDGVPGQIPLAGGDFVLLPKARPNALRNHPETRAVPFEEILAENGTSEDDCAMNTIIRHGGGGSPTSLVCGCFAYEDGGATPLVEALPPLIHIKGDEGVPVHWLESTLQFLAAESASPLPGAETIRSRLADILFVQAIRAHVATNAGTSAGWLRALTDPQVGKALRLIHERPEAHWTVDGLADRVAMSRSAFADRFRVLVGIPPLAYLTRWRIHKAAGLLRSADATVAVVARAVGYETEGSFGKVFKRYTGKAPGEYRAMASQRGGIKDAG
jgi:AraC-like DNA-binding protein